MPVGYSLLHVTHCLVLTTYLNSTLWSMEKESSLFFYKDLVTFDLSNNSLHGNINARSITRMQNLEYLDLSQNRFAGYTELSSPRTVKYLNLSHNDICPSVSESLIQLLKLRWLIWVTTWLIKTLRVQFFARPLARPLCTSTGLTLKVDVQKTGPFLFTSSFTSNEKRAGFLHVHSKTRVDVQKTSPFFITSKTTSKQKRAVFLHVHF